MCVTRTEGMSIHTARQATWVWTDSAAGEFQLLRVFPSFDFYSIKSSFFPFQPLGFLKGTHTAFKLASTKILWWKQWLMYIVVFLIYLVRVYVRTVRCCVSHSNDEVMYWTPQARAWMERNVTCGLICIAPLMAKCFPVTSLSIQTQRQNKYSF